jgi:xanthine dehydrogenase accessory factor
MSELPWWNAIQTEIAARRVVVVATIVRDSGSVPRRTGAKMLVRADGSTQGTIGGGAFESVVIRDALQALQTKRSVTHAYVFRPDPASSEKRAERGERSFGAVCGGRVEVFLEVVVPQDRLLIVGGGHCGRALARAAHLLGWEIVLCDDRDEWTQPDTLPEEVQVLLMAPDATDLPPVDESTFVALVGKGYPIDEAALRKILHQPVAYIGMIGSLRKKQTVFDNLRRDGFSDEQLQRVHAPIGLEIGAETPEEIAIAILAQIIQVRNREQPHE